MYQLSLDPVFLPYSHPDRICSAIFDFSTTDERSDDEDDGDDEPEQENEKDD